MNSFIIYFAAITVITFAVYGYDKAQAIKHKSRVSEACLMVLAAIGGSVGAWLAMQAFRHKTRHVKFTLGIPAIFLAQLAIVAWVLVEKIAEL